MSEIDARPLARARLTAEFERNRSYLRSVAYRMLGSMTEAEDAVQESWLRLDRNPPDDTADLRRWLTTVVARICLDALRSRRARREEFTDDALPEPVVGAPPSPEDEVVLADSLGVAMQVVLERLAPAERIAFVLHDVFAVPFEEIAPIIGRSAVAARQLASRARRRVQAARTEPDADLEVQRQIVDAFLAAARTGDFDALLSMLDPGVVLRRDGGARMRGLRPVVTGAADAAREVLGGARQVAPLCRPAIVNGRAGFFVGPPDRIFAVAGFTFAGARIRTIDIVWDPEKVRAVTARQA